MEEAGRLDREALKREVERGLELGRRVSRLAGETRARIILSYTGAGGVAAWTAYWILKQLAPGVQTEIQPGDALALHVLAYRESGDELSPASDTTIFLFVGPGGENQSIMVRDAAVYTGAQLVILAPRLPPLLRDRLGDEPLVEEVEGVYTIVAPIAAAILAATIAKTRGYSSIRVKRVAEEASTLTEVIDELLDRFAVAARAVRECRGPSCTCIYTPTMRSAALLHSHLYGSRPLGVQEALSLPRQGLAQRILLFYTSGDADAVREVRFRALTGGSRVDELLLPTDPLTAPLYAILVVHYGHSVD